MALLSGLGIVMMPVSQYVGGKLYEVGGYYSVYGVAMSCTFFGVAYIYFVPETITKRSKIKDQNKINLLDDEELASKSLLMKFKHIFYAGNRTIKEAYR